MEREREVRGDESHAPDFIIEFDIMPDSAILEVVRRVAATGSLETVAGLIAAHEDWRGVNGYAPIMTRELRSAIIRGLLS